MNKILKTALCLAMALTCLLCLCACGGEKEQVVGVESTIKLNITGRYELESIEWANGTIASGITLQQSEDTMGDMYLELFSDGTAQLSLLGQLHDMEFSNDKMYQTDSKLNTYDFSVSNGKVTLKNSGDTYIFVKK